MNSTSEGMGDLRRFEAQKIILDSGANEIETGNAWIGDLRVFEAQLAIHRDSGK